MSQFQAFALALTLACELPVMLLLARAIPVPKVALVATLASVITHPIAWYVASILSPDQYIVGVVLIECGVVLVEAGWYRLWLSNRFMQALGWSIAANATSFAVGWLLI